MSLKELKYTFVIVSNSYFGGMNVKGGPSDLGRKILQKY